MRGTNRFLPDDIAVQWCLPVADAFHARNSARGRRYVYVLLESRVRPALEAGLVGWSFSPARRRRDARRAAACSRRARLQRLPLGRVPGARRRSRRCARSTSTRRGAYWRFDFDASAFLHHMVRNIMGCLVAVGSRRSVPSGWLADVLAGRDRTRAAPTFSAAGLYFAGPYYDPALGDPVHDRGDGLAALNPAHDLSAPASRSAA